jgi:16S rRNA (guanine527-N7)-methyltransferase
MSEAGHSDIWNRHVKDSMQLLPLAPTAKRWLDIGSGAGFPGLVIAIQLYGVPGAEVHCVESDKRKCAFLADVVRETGVPAVIHARRIEDLDADSLFPVDAVTARALTALPGILKMTRPYLDRGAVGLFPLGRGASASPGRESGQPSYRFEAISSETSPDTTILRVQRTMV